MYMISAAVMLYLCELPGQTKRFASLFHSEKEILKSPLAATASIYFSTNNTPIIGANVAPVCSANSLLHIDTQSHKSGSEWCFALNTSANYDAQQKLLSRN